MGVELFNSPNFGMTVIQGMQASPIANKRQGHTVSCAKQNLSVKSSLPAFDNPFSKSHFCSTWAVTKHTLDEVQTEAELLHWFGLSHR